MNPVLDAVGYGTFDNVQVRLKQNYQKAIVAQEKLQLVNQNPNFRAYVVKPLREANICVENLVALREVYSKNPRAFKADHYLRLEKEQLTVEELTDFVDMKLPLITAN